MRKEHHMQIRNRIFDHVAPAHYGKVSLSDAHRLFSHLGSRREIEKCLDEFVKEKIARKVESAEGEFYVFQEIALKFGKDWSKKLALFRQEIKELEDEASAVQGKLRILEKMRNVWIDGWTDLVKDPSAGAGISNYISSVFFGQYAERVLGKLQETGKELNMVNKKIQNLESLRQASFAPTS